MKQMFEEAEQQALWEALHACGDDHFPPLPPGESYTSNGDKVYCFLENTPRTSMVVLLVDKLHEMGYKIVKETAAVH